MAAWAARSCAVRRCVSSRPGAGDRANRARSLSYLSAGDDLVVVASKGGMSHHPAWYHNMTANPDVEVQVGSTTRRMRARRASDAEKAALWPRLVAMYRDYGSE